MLLCAVLQILLWAMPPLLFCSFIGQLRKRIGFYLPMGILLQVTLSSLFSALLWQHIDRGLTFIALLTSMSVLANFLILRKIHPDFLLEPSWLPTLREICLLFGLSFFVHVDTAWIFSRQGWDFETDTAYFRPPFNNDLERHTIVINALNRRESESPFLAGTQLCYQLFWHHAVAPLIYLFEGLTSYPFVLGACLATAMVFTFLLLWLIRILRPTFFQKPQLVVIALGLLFTHTDIYHGVQTWLQTGQWGIEADWSAPPGFFRNFSLKLLLLTAPQHTFVFIWAILTLIAKVRRLSIFSAFCAVASFLASPLIWIFIFVPICLVEFCFSDRKNVSKQMLRWAGVGMISYFLHDGIFSYRLWDLFTRPGNSAIQIGVTNPFLWFQLPILWIASIGIPGLFLMVLLYRKACEGTIDRFNFLICSITVGGLIASHFLVTDIEIRRHYSILLSVLGALQLVLLLPDENFLFRKVGTTLLIAVLHSYFIYSYVGKPSHVEGGLNWKDYFQMNKKITSQKVRNVMAASHPYSVRFDYPAVMEVTASFSLPSHASAHTKLSQEQLSSFYQIRNISTLLEYSRLHGYDYILWGPIEEKVWGSQVRKRYLDTALPLLEEGAVKLYRLTNNSDTSSLEKF